MVSAENKSENETGGTMSLQNKKGSRNFEMERATLHVLSHRISIMQSTALRITETSNFLPLSKMVIKNRRSTNKKITLASLHYLHY